MEVEDDTELTMCTIKLYMYACFGSTIGDDDYSFVFPFKSYMYIYTCTCNQ